MRTRRIFVAAAAAVLAAGCSGTASTTQTTTTFSKAATPQGAWPYPNANLANTRVAPGSSIDAATGRLLWKFNTVVGPEPGVTTLGVGAGGAWETPLVGADGSVTFGIGNPYQYLYTAIEDPARMLYCYGRRRSASTTGATTIPC
jgi:hypothetical protein